MRLGKERNIREYTEGGNPSKEEVLRWGDHPVNEEDVQ